MYSSETKTSGISRSEDDPAKPQAKIRALPVLGGALLASVMLLAIFIWRGEKSIRGEAPPSHDLSPLPADVEGVMTGFIYHDISEGCAMEIRGAKVVRRGREILGFRTNLVKTGYFENISGDFRSRKGAFRFSAAQGEWAMTGNSPIVLQSGIKLLVNGNDIGGVRQLSIYPRSGVMQFRTDKVVQIINFR
jgi:hypothetical protein